jgi:RimJ/RimL family protein N-acetyltransferase
MKNSSRIDGEFINIRRLSLADAEISLSWRTADRARLLNTGAANTEQQRAWIRDRPASEHNYIIETKGNRPIGMISLLHVNQINQNAETGRFLIGDEASARGLPAAVEAMKLLYEFAFDTLSLKRIYGSVAAENTLVIKWQKYLGMKEEGRMRSHYFIDGKWQDAIILGLLADEARSVSIPRMNWLIASARKNKRNRM